MDQAKLLKDFERLTSALGEVKNLFEGFDPRRSPKQLTLGPAPVVSFLVDARRPLGGSHRAKQERRKGSRHAKS